MTDALSQDVIDYLLSHPKELQRVESNMTCELETRKRLEFQEMKPKGPIKMVPCGTYGCTRPKPEGAVFCEDCYAEYLEDPDAFK